MVKHTPRLVPQLEGRRVRLRFWRIDDAATLSDAWQDTAIRFRLPVLDPSDESAARRWIAQRDRAWSERRSLDLAVTDIVSDVVIGEVGLYDFNQVRRAAMVGWWIASDWRGQGRAGESVRLVVDWAFDSGLLNAVLAEIDADNFASIGVARHAGLSRINSPHPNPVKSNVLVFARISLG